MNNQVKGLLYFYFNDLKRSILIFWSILLLVLVVAIAFAYYLIGVEDGMMAFGFPFAIYFYCAVLGFMTVKEYIPFAIKIGATRKNIYISLGLFFLSLAVLKAIIASTIQELVVLLAKNTDLTSFMFLHPAMAVEDTWINRVLIDVCIMVFLLSFMFVIGLLFYKYGFAGGGAVAGILAIALLFGIAKGWIYEFIADLLKQTDILFFYQILGVGLLLFIVSFLIVRRVTIEKRS
ncbi:hypothetical protein [Paucisalibacillus sp. EB02]|uniref:hypothetical protein n=1 Tax=Paucisalibacillus sp. EB02 TaxID=1347087 RepID=UPI0004B6DB84|nr:hypothetical protein [Paucisalibacillus sp. EB02]